LSAVTGGSNLSAPSEARTPLDSSREVRSHPAQEFAVTVAYILDVPMNADALDAAVGQLGVGPGKAPEGQIAHIEILTAKGARVIDVWESPEAYQTFMERRLGPILGAMGAPPIDPPEPLPVHRVFVAQVGAAAQ
jgi:hypothetical protein